MYDPSIGNYIKKKSRKEKIVKSQSVQKFDREAKLGGGKMPNLSTNTLPVP